MHEGNSATSRNLVLACYDGDLHLRRHDEIMARWPYNRWTWFFTYGSIFVLFPLLCLLAYAWVNGWL